MVQMNISYRLTVYIIVKTAGISLETVSRSLDNIGYMNCETREKIKKAVDELEYTPI